jgi:hypothetical protein
MYAADAICTPRQAPTWCDGAAVSAAGFVPVLAIIGLHAVSVVCVVQTCVCVRARMRVCGDYFVEQLGDAALALRRDLMPCVATHAILK